MAAFAPLTPLVVTRQKPQAKSLSPVSRNLFGQSDASVVREMLNEVLISERQKASKEINFDIFKELPLKQEQQENISEPDRTPEVRRRFLWKRMKSTEAPEFYSRRYKGKKSLMPVDLLNCSPEPPNRSSRSVRRSLNGYLRTPSKEMEKKLSLTRSSSASRLQPSPLRDSSPLPVMNSPTCFDDSTISRTNSTILRPTAVHASTESALTTKVFTPDKSIKSRFDARSPLSQRNNHSRSARALDFTTTPKKSPLVTSFKQTQGNCTPETTPTSISAHLSEATSAQLKAPKKSTQRASCMRQLTMTETMTMRKTRSPSQKAAKRLNLSEDTATNVPSTKILKLSRSDN